MSSYHENMKFEYNIDPVRRIVKVRVVGYLGRGLKKGRFVFDRIVRIWLLICVNHEILNEMDS